MQRGAAQHEQGGKIVWIFLSGRRKALGMKWFPREPKPQQMKVIIIGCGEVGYHIAERLAKEHKQVVVVDRNPESLRRLAETADVQVLEGSGSSPRVLDEAGIANADILLAVTDSDETNIIACFFANVLAPTALKLARIRNEEYTLYRDALAKEYLNIAMVINPEVEVVKRIDRLVTMPGTTEYIEYAEGRVVMAGIRVEAGPLAGIPLTQLRTVLGGLPVVVGAIIRQERLIVPGGEDSILLDDLVYFVCEKKDLPTVYAASVRERRPIRNVMIIGGGNIGLRTAALFEQRGYHAKLVDRNEERCAALARQLRKTIVLHGDGTDQDFLREENVGAMDVVVSLTGDEETNILTSLLSKSLGAARTITRINNAAYLPLVRTIGIEHSVSPRLSAVNSILHYVRRGKVLSSTSIKGDEAEALEALAQEGSRIVGKTLREVKLPKGALLLCIIRNDEVIVPHGDSVVQPQDRVIIFSTSKLIPRVEQALMGAAEQD